MADGPERLKIALDELRMQMLGAQVLFGFQFQALFQDLSQDLPLHRKLWSAVGFAGIVLTQGFLVSAPSQHRLAEEGQATARMERSTNRYSEFTLLALAIALTCDVYVVCDTHFGMIVAAAVAAATALSSVLLWYGVAALVRRRQPARPRAGKQAAKPAASLHEKIDLLLTEARVILPGAQALLGFQFIVTLTRAFADLPSSARLVHFVALACTVVTVMLLITPAAVHRIAFGGEDSERFLRLGGGIVTTALVPLALGIAADVGIAAFKLFESTAIAATAGSVTLIVLLALWYLAPLMLRR